MKSDAEYWESRKVVYRNAIWYKQRVEVKLDPSDVKHPYFDMPSPIYDAITADLSDKGKRAFANLCAHHMFPCKRLEQGWLFTRSDMQKENYMVLMTNEGQELYIRSEAELKEREEVWKKEHNL